MKATQLIMGMPITVEIVDRTTKSALNTVFDYFKEVDAHYSPYKKSSEVSRINAGLPESEWSPEMRTILELCEQTQRASGGYFDAYHGGRLDPSGLVKGWSISRAAQKLREAELTNYYIEAGGDIQVSGQNQDRRPWVIGIRNPYNIDEVIKVVELSHGGVATSGTYIRGQHIYDPVAGYRTVDSVKSLTVIGPDVYEADRFATAAYAMGRKGIAFIEAIPGLEGYMVDDDKMATYTNGFDGYIAYV